MKRNWGVPPREEMLFEPEADDVFTPLQVKIVWGLAWIISIACVGAFAVSLWPI